MKSQFPLHLQNAVSQQFLSPVLCVSPKYLNYHAKHVSALFDLSFEEIHFEIEASCPNDNLISSSVNGFHEGTS
jgi:hypothetical protein